MPRKILVGKVLSRKMDKTAVVVVPRTAPHPLYRKTITTEKKYHAHDEDNRCQAGDMVRIRESRPFSKTKTWEVVEWIGSAEK